MIDLIGIVTGPIDWGIESSADQGESGILESLVDEHPELKDMTLAEASNLYHFGTVPKSWRGSKI